MGDRQEILKAISGKVWEPPVMGMVMLELFSQNCAFDLQDKPFNNVVLFDAAQGAAIVKKLVA